MTFAVAAVTEPQKGKGINLVIEVFTNVTDADHAKGKFLTLLEKQFPHNSVVSMVIQEAPDTGIDPALVREFFAAQDTDGGYDRISRATQALREAVGQ